MTTERTPERTSWRPLIAAWLGWAFDGLDGYLYVMVALPFVSQLIANQHHITPDEAKATMLPLIQSRAALIQAVFLLGWACGGVVFGRIGDRLGRSKTLTITILTYAIFTGVSFFAQNWWQLMIFRFLAALGIGGEWAAGSALVAETLPRKHRDWASAVLQSGYILGCIVATMSAGWITAHFEVKYVFLVGVLPAFVTMWIRHSVPEPAEWSNARGAAPQPRIADLFSPELRRTTILLLIHISIALTVVWAFLFFTPQMISKMEYFKELSKHDQEAMKTRITVAYFAANIVANFVATFLMKKLGARWAFGLLMGLALVTLCVGFRTQPTVDNIYFVTCAYAMTGLGLFAIFPLYVPPLFPTLLRTLGAGLTYNFGRITAAIGTLAAGELISTAGGPAQVVFWVGMLYVPGLVVCAMLPRRE